MNQAERREATLILAELERRKARKHLLPFTQRTFPKFESTDFHETYYNILELFAKGEIKKLIVSMPPQHGKSEGSTRRLPSTILGRNPDAKVAIGSYSDTFAKKFNRDCQRIMDNQDYLNLFPETKLNGSKISGANDTSMRTANEFEIVGREGSLKAVGRGGALTGNPVDIMIMDDLYKDYMEGNSPTIRASVWDWYINVVLTRLHNDSQQLIVFTRWHEDDLIGRLEKKEKVVTINSLGEINGLNPDVWVKINFEAIKTSAPTELDPREKGEALYPSKHNIKKLEDTRALDPERFNCLYQGNPRSKEGMMYDDFKTYKELPENVIRKNKTDTADTGKDYLCSICYDEDRDGYKYVVDVLYTQKSMEFTEPLTADLLMRNNVKRADIESNNGGRGFARKVKAMTPSSIKVEWYHESDNKEARIFSNHATVNELIIMPENWHIRWPEFYDHVTNYKKLFKANEHDDAADTLTAIVENKGMKRIRATSS